MYAVDATVDEEINYWFPHHGVLNENSETTKLRVVFDGSAKTDSGISFNHIQYIGPRLQDDLFLGLLRFREYVVDVCGDVAKMYRMIWLDQSQRSLQKIIWRSSATYPLVDYTLNTVTYFQKMLDWMDLVSY